MPKVSDYELEHLDDEKFEHKKQKKTKQPKEKKYSDHCLRYRPAQADAESSAGNLWCCARL